MMFRAGCFSFFVLIALILAIAENGFGQCRVHLASVDAVGTVIPEVKFTLFDHRTMKELKAVTKSEQVYIFDEGGAYSVAAYKNGYFTSNVLLPQSCTDALVSVNVQMVSGKSSKRILIADRAQPLHQNGQVFFNRDQAYVLGESWPKPSLTAACKSNCNVVIQVTVDQNGKVLEINRTEGDERSFKAIKSAMMAGKFKPVYLAGQFIPIMVEMVFHVQKGN